MITGLFILPLASNPPADTVFLSCARALETASFACLYVWTPEVSTAPLLLMNSGNDRTGVAYSAGEGPVMF